MRNWEQLANSRNPLQSSVPSIQRRSTKDTALRRLTNQRFAAILSILDISNVDSSRKQEHVMQTRQRDPDPLLPLTPAVFHILLSLLGGDHHGYGIMQEVNGYTQGKVRLGPGTLYRSIKQMLAQGLIIEWDERPDPALDDQRRRYYRLTDFGHRVLTAETERLEQVLQVARAKQRGPRPEPTTTSGGGC